MNPKVKSRAAAFAPVPAWRWWLTGALVIGIVLALAYGRRTQPLPPPVVNTAGFDPVIAAAIRQAREGVLAAPRSGEARGHLGMVLLAHDVRPQAVECLNQAAALAPQEPHWPYFLGLAQVADNPAAAVTNLTRAVELAPNQIGPRLTLADTLLGLSRTAEAESQYQTILQTEPRCARARLGLGRVANVSGRIVQAAEFLEGAVQDPSTRKAAHRLLLTIYQRLGRTNDAERLARVLPALPADEPFADPYVVELQQLKTGEAAWIETGEEWIKAGRIQEAAALLEKTVQTYPKSDRAMFLLGRARFRLGDKAGAEEILTRATQLAPGSVEAHVQLGIVQLAQRHTKDAQRSFRAAIQAKPNLADAWFNLGLSLGNENRAESVAAFREAIRLKPASAEAYLALALVLRADGQKQAAVDELQHALTLDLDEPLRQKLLDQLKLLEQR